MPENSKRLPALNGMSADREAEPPSPRGVFARIFSPDSIPDNCPSFLALSLSINGRHPTSDFFLMFCAACGLSLFAVVFLIVCLMFPNAQIVALLKPACSVTLGIVVTFCIMFSALNGQFDMMRALSKRPQFSILQMDMGSPSLFLHNVCLSCLLRSSVIFLVMIPFQLVCLILKWDTASLLPMLLININLLLLSCLLPLVAVTNLFCCNRFSRGIEGLPGILLQIGSMLTLIHGGILLFAWSMSDEKSSSNMNFVQQFLLTGGYLLMLNCLLYGYAIAYLSLTRRGNFVFPKFFLLLFLTVCPLLLHGGCLLFPHNDLSSVMNFCMLFFALPLTYGGYAFSPEGNAISASKSVYHSRLSDSRFTAWLFSGTQASCCNWFGLYFLIYLLYDVCFFAPRNWPVTLNVTAVLFTVCAGVASTLLHSILPSKYYIRGIGIVVAGCLFSVVFAIWQGAYLALGPQVSEWVPFLQYSHPISYVLATAGGCGCFVFGYWIRKRDGRQSDASPARL